MYLATDEVDSRQVTAEAARPAKITTDELSGRCNGSSDAAGERQIGITQVAVEEGNIVEDRVPERAVTKMGVADAGALHDRTVEFRKSEVSELDERVDEGGITQVCEEFRVCDVEAIEQRLLEIPAVAVELEQMGATPRNLRLVHGSSPTTKTVLAQGGRGNGIAL